MTAREVATGARLHPGLIDLATDPDAPGLRQVGPALYGDLQQAVHEFGVYLLSETPSGRLMVRRKCPKERSRV